MTSLRTFSPRTLSFVALLALVGLAACGGSTKKVDPAADLALAKAAVLTSADLPGYTGTPYTASDDLPANDKQIFATCMQAPTTVFDDTPGEQKANSENFAKADAEVQNTVEIFPKRSDADSHWTQISKTQTPGCLKELFEASIKAGAPSTSAVTFTKADVVRFDVGIGSRSTGFAVDIAATSGGQSASFYVDVLFVQRDRAEVSFFSSGNTSAPDRTFETGLVQKVYDRIGTKAS